MSPVRRTCVPPHSSIDQAGLLPSRRAPIETTRTSSPYFSPNSAMAPSSTAAAGVIRRVMTSEFSRMRAFTSASTHGDVVVGQRARLADVETQPVRRVQAALLRDVRAEALAQRLVQQVRGAVVRADGGAAGMIDLGDDRRADLRGAGLDAAEMDEQVAELLLRVGDRDAQAVGRR